MIKVLLFFLFLPCFLFSAENTGVNRTDFRMEQLRKDHPRLFFNADQLPAIRRYARQYPQYLQKLLAKADNYPDDPPYRELTHLFRRSPDGTLRPKRQGTHARKLLQYAGGEESAVCALAYLFTGDTRYRAKAHKFLALFVRALQFSAEGQCWIDSAGNTRINAMLAYDILYHDLTPAERKAIILPLLEYTRNAQKNGKFKFRRTLGSYTGGNYGEDALEYFLGITLYGDGIADAEAETMLRRGTQLFVKMMDHRDRISAGSGLLSSLTLTYAFSTYPLATHLFLYSSLAAFGKDMAPQWSQMLHFHRYVDAMTFLPSPDGTRKLHGVGDIMHLTNTIKLNDWMFTHIANNIHFYGKHHPEKAREMYAFLATLPPRSRHLSGTLYPMMPFLCTAFDPAEIKPMPRQTAPYFYNARFGMLAVRSGNGIDDTYACFRFGGDQFPHQQYDDLSFVIYKHDYLALDAGSRTETAHHHHFASQSVAHNTLLIHMAKEPMAHFWKPWGFKPDGKTYYSHGGQNSTVRGKALALQSGPDFIYAAGDASGNYSPTKCKEATRQWVWLKPDIFVIYDRVTSVHPEQKKEFLLHFLHKPEAVSPAIFRADAGKGRLFVQQLLPAQAKITLVGGPGKEFFASGRNWPLSSGKNYRYAGSWRLETTPVQAARETRFLHVLQASCTDTAAPVPATLRQEGEWDQVTIGPITLHFRRHGKTGLILQRGHVKQILPDKVEVLP